MKYLLSYIWAILWGAVILALLLMPSGNFSGAPRFEGIDKMVHCGIFFVQASLLYWESAIKSKRRANKWLVILKVLIVTCLYAVGTEYAQMYLTNTRSGDPWDAFADTVGIGMATFSFILLYKQEKESA